MTVDTGWHLIPTTAPGLAKPGPIQPRQVFRIRYTAGRILTDLSGLRLDQSTPGIAELGTIPGWAAAAIAEQTFWINDDPAGIHQSVVAIHQGRTLYWTGQIVKGVVSVTRPASLHGGFEYTPDKPKETP